MALTRQEYEERVGAQNRPFFLEGGNPVRRREPTPAIIAFEAREAKRAMEAEALESFRSMLGTAFNNLYAARTQDVEARKKDSGYTFWDDGFDEMRATFLLLPGDRQSGETIALTPSGEVVVFEAIAIPHYTGETMMVPKDKGLIARKGLLPNTTEPRFGGIVPTRRGAMHTPYSNGEPAPKREY